MFRSSYDKKENSWNYLKCILKYLSLLIIQVLNIISIECKLKTVFHVGLNSLKRQVEHFLKMRKQSMSCKRLEKGNL